MTVCWTRLCFGQPMPEPMTAQAALPHPVLLSRVQVDFLMSLIPGPRPTTACQDAITVGSLMRLNLVAWNEIAGPAARRRRGKSTFSLTPAAMWFLTHREARQGAG